MNRHELRIGDHERDAAVTALGEHYIAGRLSKDEYDERAGVAWQARTNSDLAPLFYDLPPLQPRQLSPTHSPPRAPTALPGKGRHGGVPVMPVLLLVLIVALASELPVWPLLLLWVVYLWGKSSFWRARARKHEPRGTRRTASGPWQQKRPF